MNIRLINSGMLRLADAEVYVARNGTIFFDEVLGVLRIGDGYTPGGRKLSISTAGNVTTAAQPRTYG